MPLKLSTKTSLFKPIEVEIDGKIYYGAKFSADLFNKLKEKEEGARAGDLDALYDQVRAIFPDIPLKILKELDLRDLRVMVDDAMNQVMKPVKVMAGEEKKAGGPGQAAAQK